MAGRTTRYLVGLTQHIQTGTAVGNFAKPKLIDLKYRMETKLYDHLIVPEYDRDLETLIRVSLPRVVLSPWNGDNFVTIYKNLLLSAFIKITGYAGTQVPIIASMQESEIVYQNEMYHIHVIQS